jgi:hypothetical protein
MPDPERIRSIRARDSASGLAGSAEAHVRVTSDGRWYRRAPVASLIAEELQAGTQAPLILGGRGITASTHQARKQTGDHQ